MLAKTILWLAVQFRPKIVVGVRLALKVSISDIRGTFEVGRVRDEGLEDESYHR